DIGIHVGAIDEAKRITGDEGSCFQIPVAEAFVEEACRVFVLGVGFLTVVRCALFSGALAVSLISGFVGQGTIGGCFCNNVATVVIMVITGRASPDGVKDAADASAVVGAADIFDSHGRGHLFLDAGAAAE